MNEGALVRPSQGTELILAEKIPKAIGFKNFANARNCKQISSFPRELHQIALCYAKTVLVSHCTSWTGRKG
jgi:hypothetical protein